jgi:inorganic pyrophosphatase/exopolyphosphatase
MNGHITMKLITKRNRDLLDKGEFLLAFLLTSVDLEFYLLTKIALEKEVKVEETKIWTLGILVDKSKKEKLIDKNNYKILKNFANLRNIVAHRRNILNQAMDKKNERLNELLKSGTKKVIEFLEKDEISHPWNSKREREYYEYLNKKDSLENISFDC